MTVQEFLIRSTNVLKQAGIASARLDTIVLLEDALGQDRALVLANLEQEISAQTEIELNTKVTQRAQHTPLAYIRSKVEFYGREFAINKHVLVPRPETETMIDLLKGLNFSLLGNDPYIVDIGTGSGAIATTAKLEFPNSNVIATDIDSEALKVTRQNAKKLSADIRCLQGDLLKALKPFSKPTILLANLPYVPERYTINQAAEHEPKHAIFGGKDGLNLYRNLWGQITDLTDPPIFVLTEALPPQHAEMTVLAQGAGYQVHTSQDFIQVFRKV